MLHKSADVCPECGESLDNALAKARGSHIDCDSGRVEK